MKYKQIFTCCGIFDEEEGFLAAILHNSLPAKVAWSVQDIS